MDGLIIGWRVTRADLVWDMIITHREYRPDILTLHFCSGNEWKSQEECMSTHCELRTPSLTLTPHLMHTLIRGHHLHALAHVSAIG